MTESIGKVILTQIERDINRDGLYITLQKFNGDGELYPVVKFLKRIDFKRATEKALENALSELVLYGYEQGVLDRLIGGEEVSADGSELYGEFYKSTTKLRALITTEEIGELYNEIVREGLNIDLPEGYTAKDYYLRLTSDTSYRRGKSKHGMYKGVTQLLDIIEKGRRTNGQGAITKSEVQSITGSTSGVGNHYGIQIISWVIDEGRKGNLTTQQEDQLIAHIKQLGYTDEDVSNLREGTTSKNGEKAQTTDLEATIVEIATAEGTNRGTRNVDYIQAISGWELDRVKREIKREETDGTLVRYYDIDSKNINVYDSTSITGWRKFTKGEVSSYIADQETAEDDRRRLAEAQSKVVNDLESGVLIYTKYGRKEAYTLNEPILTEMLKGSKGITGKTHRLKPGADVSKVKALNIRKVKRVEDITGGGIEELDVTELTETKYIVVPEDKYITELRKYEETKETTETTGGDEEMSRGIPKRKVLENLIEGVIELTDPEITGVIGKVTLDPHIVEQKAGEWRTAVAIVSRLRIKMLNSTDTNHVLAVDVDNDLQEVKLNISQLQQNGYNHISREDYLDRYVEGVEEEAGIIPKEIFTKMERDLENGYVEFRFKKTDGETRVMRATRNPEIIEEITGEPSGELNFRQSYGRDFMQVYDMERKAPRAFKPSRVLKKNDTEFYWKAFQKEQEEDRRKSFAGMLKDLDLGVVEFEFTKVNGEIRPMLATRNIDYVTEVTGGRISPREVSELDASEERDYIQVIDLEKYETRAFKPSTVNVDSEGNHVWEFRGLDVSESERAYAEEQLGGENESLTESEIREQDNYDAYNDGEVEIEVGEEIDVESEVESDMVTFAEQLRMLGSGELTFKFTKMNGELREMRATRNVEYISEELGIPETEVAGNNYLYSEEKDYIQVFDLDKRANRTYKPSRVEAGSFRYKSREELLESVKDVDVDGWFKREVAKNIKSNQTLSEGEQAINNERYGRIKEVTDRMESAGFDGVTIKSSEPNQYVQLTFTEGGEVVEDLGITPTLMVTKYGQDVIYDYYNTYQKIPGYEGRELTNGVAKNIIKGFEKIVKEPRRVTQEYKPTTKQDVQRAKRMVESVKKVIVGLEKSSVKGLKIETAGTLDNVPAFRMESGGKNGTSVIFNTVSVMNESTGEYYYQFKGTSNVTANNYIEARQRNPKFKELPENLVKILDQVMILSLDLRRKI